MSFWKYDGYGARDKILTISNLILDKLEVPCDFRKILISLFCKKKVIRTNILIKEGLVLLGRRVH